MPICWLFSTQRVRPKVSKDRRNFADGRSQTCVVVSDDLWEFRDRRREQRHDHVLRPGETRMVWMPFVLPMRDEAGSGTPIFPQHSAILQAREIIRREVFEVRSAAKQFRNGKPTRRAHDLDALPA